jgi:hypothetical protein
MRKALKYIVISILSISLLLVFGGCEEDGDDEQKYSVIGSWLMSSVVLKDTPIGDLTMTASGFLGQSGTGAQTSTLILNEDGTAATITSYEAAPDSTEPGTWSQDGNKLAIEGAGIDDIVPFSVGSTSLTLTLTIPIDFDLDGVADDTQVDMTYEKI